MPSGLTGDTIVPQIDIFNCSNNKLFLSTFWGNPTDANGIQKDTASISASKIYREIFYLFI